jgi:hypothetical protein
MPHKAELRKSQFFSPVCWASLLVETMMKNVVILLSTAAGAALGFRMLDSYRADARLEKQRIVERIIEEEVAKQRS